MRKVILHVGAHKTGSTFIQGALAQNRALLAAAGVGCVARRDVGLGPMKAWINRKQLPVARAYLRDLIEAQSPGLPVIVSYENLFGTTSLDRGEGICSKARQRARKLRQLTEGYETKVVVYIRAQAAFLESCYLQVVQQGRAIPFYDYLQKIPFWSLSWEEPVAAFEAEFPGLEVRCFEAIREGDRAFVLEFLRICTRFFGVDPRPIEAGLDLTEVWGNPSYSGPGLQLALAAASVLDEAERRHFRRLLQTTFSTETFRRADLTRGLVAELLARHHGPGNRRLLARYGLEQYAPFYC